MPLALILAVLVLLPASTAAQTRSPAWTADAIAGYTGFADESLIGHAAVGGAIRLRLMPRLSVGPEIVFMTGPGRDRDLFVTGNVWIHFLERRPDAARAGSVSPFVVVGGGLMRHSTRFGATTFSRTEPAFTTGAGMRVWLTERVYALGEFRMGSELHFRTTGGIGVAW